MEYRRELKYIVKSSDLAILEQRMNTVMKLDKNVFDGNAYNIRSIYFDNYYNEYFYDNEDGVNERLKIRMRIYNRSDSIIKLEIKYKNNGVTKKEACCISRAVCDKLIRGEKLNITDCKNNKVLNKIYIEEHTKLLKPKVIVEYERRAYVDYIGNVRITFDTNIRASKYIDRFFEEDIYAAPILETGAHVLEVKYDELLPDYISGSIELNTLEQTAFSKYYLSRLRFEEEII